MSRKLDVLFVNPGNLREVYQGLADTYSAIEPPVFAGFIARFLQLNGLAVDIIDAPALNLGYEEVAEEVAAESPHLVVLAVYGYQPSASSQNMPAARKTAQAIKDLLPDLPILVTGTHPAALPERTLREEPVDFVCDGEGHLTILGLAKALNSGETDYGSVPGLLYWADKEMTVLKRTPAAPLIKEGDRAMPGIAWELLPMERYRAHNWHCGYGSLDSRMPYASIITSLGCPYRCEFCCIQAPFKSGEGAIAYKPEVNSYRLRSPERVLEEITLLVEKYGVRNFKFHDEMFVLNKRHVLEIARLIRGRFGDSLNIWAYARVDTTKEELLQELRAAGFRWLCLGIESANSTVRDGQDKSFTDDEIYRVVGRIKAADINVGGNFILGLPNDTLESMAATLRMARELQPELFNLYCAMAYPGSRLYEEAQEKGWPLPGNPGCPGWIGFSQHSYLTFPLPTATVPASEVLRLRDKAFLNYHADPRFHATLRQRFGEPAVRHVQAMVKMSLKRWLLERNEI